jgi:hypothetical protein
MAAWYGNDNKAETVLRFSGRNYFSGFRINAMRLPTGFANYCLEQSVGTFGWVVVNFVPDLHLHSSYRTSISEVGHGEAPATGGSVIELSATDAWAKSRCR